MRNSPTITSLSARWTPLTAFHVFVALSAAKVSLIDCAVHSTSWVVYVSRHTRTTAIACFDASSTTANEEDIGPGSFGRDCIQRRYMIFRYHKRSPQCILTGKVEGILSQLSRPLRSAFLASTHVQSGREISWYGGCSESTRLLFQGVPRSSGISVADTSRCALQIRVIEF